MKNATNAIDDLIGVLEARRREYNAAVDRAIAAIRNDKPRPSLPRGMPTLINGTIVKGSAMDRALGVLRKAGEAMHVEAIIEALGEGAPKRTVMVSALERGVKRGIVERPQPATYRLVRGGDG